MPGRNIREAYDAEKSHFREAKWRKNEKTRQNVRKKSGLKEQETGIDYRIYSLEGKELLSCILKFSGLDLAAGVLFFNHFAAILILLPFFYPWYRRTIQKKAEERRKQLCYDFRDALNYLTVSLRAGRAIEHAFADAAGELRLVKAPDTPIVLEFDRIVSKLRLAVPVEELLDDFALRSGVEEIENFAIVFSTAKRTGGNLAVMIRRAAETIEGKIDVEREIDAMLAAKKMEQKIMSVMPAGIIAYMRMTSPGYLDSVYESVFGLLMMSVCLASYIGAVLWGESLTAIDV